MKGVLVLEDGSVFEGEAFGSRRDALGEVVFATGMTGYQESLTDPSYCGQILVSSYPLIGNYGINPGDSQSSHVQVWGHVVGEACVGPSHRSSVSTLDDLLRRDGVPGISGVDTRAIIRRLRTNGTMRGGITTSSPETMLERVTRMRHPEKDNLVGTVSTKKVLEFRSGKARTVAVLDCGVKKDIILALRKRFDVVQMPFDTSESDIRALDPDGVFITNGPGDPSHPEVVGSTVRTIAALKNDYPMMGICLGNQLLALAFGARTFKLKFGHRGANQPVGHSGRVYITSQNHGFAVDAATAQEAGFEITHINLNDGTVEGMRHRELPVMSVQFHPEAHPGPHDTSHLFDAFGPLMEGRDG